VEWYLETDGSNLEEILNLPFVDSYRTYSNDIWEIYNLFGIEAVRAYIVEELTQLMPTIHRTHITLLADRMTVSGRLRSISRYTRKHEHSSVLSKATFEETLSGFLRSGMMNEVDTVNGSSASIICGRIPKVGTGLNDLML
jgi:DNA-directed RNA polymerase II subunit RPB1